MNKSNRNQQTFWPDRLVTCAFFDPGVVAHVIKSVTDLWGKSSESPACALRVPFQLLHRISLRCCGSSFNGAPPLVEELTSTPEAVRLRTRPDCDCFDAKRPTIKVAYDITHRHHSSASISHFGVRHRAATLADLFRVIFAAFMTDSVFQHFCFSTRWFWVRDDSWLINSPLRLTRCRRKPG